MLINIYLLPLILAALLWLPDLLIKERNILGGKYIFVIAIAIGQYASLGKEYDHQGSLRFLLITLVVTNLAVNLLILLSNALHGWRMKRRQRPHADA